MHLSKATSKSSSPPIPHSLQNLKYEEDYSEMEAKLMEQQEEGLRLSPVRKIREGWGLWFCNHTQEQLLFALFTKLEMIISWFI